MPTYQYACTACDHRFDTVQSFSDPSLTECPECAGKLRKLYGSVGVVFKGSGFYRTDSRSEAKSAATTATTDKPADKQADKPAAAATTAKKDTSSTSSSSSNSSNSTNSSSSSSGNATAKVAS